MSPSPMAPSSASVRACRATSASEWPSERMRVGDADAAQPDVVAGHEAVHVEALPVRTSGRRWQLRSAMARSSAVVSLMLAALPGTSATGRPAHSATAASSVRSRCRRPRRAAWAARMSAKRKPCGVCARHSPARSRVAATRSSGAGLLERVGQGDGGDGAGRWPSAASTRSMISAVTNGRAASWISTRSGACGASAARPLRTETCRVAPPAIGGEQSAAAPTRRSPPRRAGSSPRAITTCTRSMAGCRRNTPSVRASTGSPPMRTYCFGSGPAARVPRPAATISAAVFKPRASRSRGWINRALP